MEPSIERYLNVRQAYCPDFFGDDLTIAFLSTMGGVPQLWQVGIDAAAPTWPDQLTFDSERVLGLWCAPPSSERRLIYARDVGGNENAQLFMLDAATPAECQLTAGHDTAMHTFGTWTPDGSAVMFAANRRDPTIFDLYLQQLDGEARIVWQNDRPGFLHSQALSPDSRHALVARARDTFHDDLWEIDLRTGAARQLCADQQGVRFTHAVYSSDGQTIFLVTDRDAEFLYLARLDPATESLTPLVVRDWDIELLIASPDRRQMAYIVNVDGTSRLEIYDLATGTTRTCPTFDPVPGVIGQLDGRLAWSADGQRLAFTWSSANRTADIWVWELATETCRAVTRSSHGGLPTDSFVAPELIHYPTFDGRQIPAWWYRPAVVGNEPAPAIVIVHGGPEGQFQPGFQFLAQYFLNCGYAVLAPNVRGSTGYGKSYSHLDDRRQRMDSVADLTNAAKWLQAQPAIDGKRLVVYGASYGGFMVLATLTTNPDLWAAGVDIVGISNLATFLRSTSAYRRAHREAEYGSLEHDRDWMEETAPLNHADRIAAPLLVIHGANDPRVPVGEAHQLVEVLQRRGVPVKLLVFDDEGHGIVKLKNKLVAYPAIVAFLHNNLNSAAASSEPPDSVTPDRQA